MQGITWTSSNTAVATVSTGGLVTGLSPRTATITAAATDNSQHYKTCSITVTGTAVAVTGIALDRSTATVKKNDTLQLFATLEPLNTTYNTVVWSSSDPDVATVDSNGVVTGVAPGTATINCGR